MATKKQKEELRDLVIKDFKRYYPLEQGGTVYTYLKNVSSNGMSRHIALFEIQDNKIYNISRIVGEILGYKLNKSNDALVVSGCGMDMGYHLVYSLGSVLWPNGSEHFITGRNGDTKPEKDGGYLLQHKWL